MRTLAAALGLILAIQVVLVAVVYWPDDSSGGTGQWRALSAVNSAVVEEIHIGDEFDNELVLRYAGDRWELPELGRLPADGAHVAGLLTRLTETAAGWPVAQTAAARQRFQVADYRYQRRIALMAKGDLLDTIYLGTSPGFRRVHARNGRSDAVYSIEFNTFDAPAREDAWLDRGLLQTRVPVSVSSDLYDLRREGEHWVSGWGVEPDERELKVLLLTLENLQVQGIADDDSQRDLATTEPALVLHVDGLNGSQTLELLAAGDGHFVHSSRYPLFFTLSAYDYDRLAGLDGERLMRGPPDGHAAAAPGGG